MPGRVRLFRAGGRLYAQGLGESVRENASAFGFSIMITATFGAVVSLEPKPPAWTTFLFAFGAVAGFTAVLAASTLADDPEDADAEPTQVMIAAALFNFASVLAAVGAAALVAWLGTGWWVWLVAPVAASAVYLLVNGLEYAVAEEEEHERA